MKNNFYSRLYPELQDRLDDEESKDLNLEFLTTLRKRIDLDKELRSKKKRVPSRTIRFFLDDT